MRSRIEHSGAVNADPRFTFNLVEVRGASLAVTNDVLSLSVQVSEAELTDLLVRGLRAIEDRRLRDRFDTGAITFEEYEAAVREMDRTRFVPVLQPVERETKE